MSPQAALHTSFSTESAGACPGSRRIRMSTSDIARAADFAFALRRCVTDKGQTEAPTIPTSEESPLPCDAASACPAVRFNLKKRKPAVAPLASVNSAFLSGLFADIAEATSGNTCSALSVGEDSDVPRKKSRVSLTGSLSRSRKSFAALGDAIPAVSVKRPYSLADPVSDSSVDAVTDSPRALSRHNSLTYQLNCVSSSSGSESDECDNAFNTTLLFPHLPATVSESSCSSGNLTQAAGGSHAPRTVNGAYVSEGKNSGANKNKESYGWFVEMDDDDSPAAPNAYIKSTSQTNLAFSAPTAPKADDHDAEVERALAADTVDDVLGDFF